MRKTLKTFVLLLIPLGMFGFALRHAVTAQPTLPSEPMRLIDIPLVAGSGVIEAETENIAVGSHLPGMVAEVYAAVGQEVEAGAPLFRLDDRQVRAELKVRTAKLEAKRAILARQQAQPRAEEIPPAEAKLAEAEALSADARQQYERAVSLAGRSVVSEEELTRKKYACEAAAAAVERAKRDLAYVKAVIDAWKYDIAAAEAEVRLAVEEVEQTKAELARLTVTAPVAGTVLQKNIRPGEYVGLPPGQGLMVLGKIKTLHVRVDIDENDIPRWSKDMIGYATYRGRAEPQFPLRFVRVEPYVVPKKSLTGTTAERVDVRVLQLIYAIDPKSTALFVGQQLDVRLFKPDDAQPHR